MTKVGLYAIGTSTTLESNKSLHSMSSHWVGGGDFLYQPSHASALDFLTKTPLFSVNALIGFQGRGM